MSLKSLYSGDKSCVFRETFNSQSDVERNGGTCTYIVFSNGTAYFNGTSSKIDYGNTDKMKFNSKNAFSFRCIVKATDLTSRIILTKWQIATPSQNTEYAIRIENTNRIRFYVTNIVSDAGTMFLDTTDANLNTTDYIELVFVFNGAGSTNADKIKVYKNGILLNATYSGAAIPSTLSNSSAKFTLGDFTGSVNQPFKGYMKLIEAYNKALTTEEVLNLYNKNNTKDVKNGLILDIDARGGSIIDRYGNSLTITNVLAKKDNNTVSCYFDGSTTTQIPCPISIPSTNTTINLWVRQTIGNTTYCSIFGNNNNVNTLYLRSGSDTAYYGFPTWTSVNLGYIRWRRLMLTISINNSGGLRFYINGVEKTSGYIASGQSFPNSMVFGCSGTATSHRMRGYQNQMRIYNRVLSAAEISQLYNYQKKNYE
jgi:hypothetical protein